MEKEKIINNLLKKFIGSKLIILFGAGSRGREVLKIIESEKIGKVDCFIDNKIDENYINNVPIYKVDRLNNLNLDQFIIIICTDDRNIYLQINKQLKNLELRENENFLSSKILRRELKSDEDNPYEDYILDSTYAPWLKDKEFIDCYNKISGNTLVDIYRCYEIWCLIEQSSKLSKGIFLEIGVWRGGTGVLIAQKARLVGINENIYLCDTFNGVVKASNIDKLYKGGEHCDTSEDYVNNLINEFKIKKVKILKGIFPEDTKYLIKEEYIRFCHIDVDVYESAKDVFNFVWDRVISGGIVVFDDFGFKTCNGIAKLIEEIKNKKDSLIIENLNGHAIVIKVI
ncbi:hypothetical protein FDB28_13000 [Clostridium botulinum]|uniref:TylF/MycF/NovP-related O-methyltransferase n=1 Tax=unclassified Clostridium TaxID=2614128 RepID=UPI0002F02F76|nr:MULTISPECIES: TylF/MycF/NovP-related O-methyltransferase [unclassified Clostridium]MBN1052589.1 hypothetical protein [Clostridium botulinum]MBN1055754.1 hypothetical protein [Clostridium botulinum]NFN94985.1 hypothetical protein [Clostridium botulinum]NFS95790.1 hypothetical protein [Clostridium botulinum]